MWRLMRAEVPPAGGTVHCWQIQHDSALSDDIFGDSWGGSYGWKISTFFFSHASHQVWFARDWFGVFVQMQYHLLETDWTYGIGWCAWPMLDNFQEGRSMKMYNIYIYMSMYNIYIHTYTFMIIQVSMSVYNISITCIINVYLHISYMLTLGGPHPEAWFLQLPQVWAVSSWCHHCLIEPE